MPRWRADFGGPVHRRSTTLIGQDLHQARLVHHPVTVPALCGVIVEVKSIQFLFPNTRLRAATGHLERLTAVQCQHMRARYILGEGQLPTLAEAGILIVQWVEGQAQRQLRPDEIIAGQCWQCDCQRVLPRARVDAVLQETLKVGSVGVNDTGHITCSQAWRRPTF
ncbi:hypothetical protein D3C76_488840 [compost metagenome]